MALLPDMHMGMILSLREQASVQLGGGKKKSEGPDVIGIIQAHARHSGKNKFSLNEVM